MIKLEKDNVVYEVNEGTIVYSALVNSGFKKVKKKKKAKAGEINE